MKIIFNSNLDDPAEWIPELKARMPELEVEVWPDIADPRAIDAALIWTQPPDGLKGYPNLKAILSLGAGINQLDLASLPQGVPLARLIDPALTEAMKDFCLYAALRYQRQFDDHAAAQAQRKWIYRQPRAKAQTRVGVMGLGELGGAAARALADLGFAVRGWARTSKSIDRVRCFTGAEGLEPFARETDILICLLPLTAATRGILNKTLFRMLPTGARLVNPGRGAHLIEADLLTALETGRIAHAMLDVFSQEPLPPEHPFWSHPKIVVTPHVASFCTAVSAAPVLVENFHRAMAGRPLLNQVDLDRGY